MITINRVFNIVALVCHGIGLAYGIFISVALYLGIGGVSEFIGQDAVAGAALSFLGGAIMLVAFLLALLFTLIALVPFVLKFIRVFVNLPALDAFCVVISAFIAIFALLFALSLTEPLALALSIVCCVASIAATVLDVLSATTS